MTGALPFSECNERLSLFAIKRPTGANAIWLRKTGLATKKTENAF